MPWMLILTWARGHWKLLAYVAGGLVICFLIKLYGNRAWEQGVAYGDTRTAVKLQKEMEQRWVVEQKQLDVQRRQLDVAVKANEDTRRVLDARATELARARLVLELAVKQALEKAQAAVKTGYQSAAAVSDAELAATLRAVSGALERERQAPGPPE